MGSLEYYERTKDTFRFRAYRIWNNARQRAKRGGYEFSITREWVEERLMEGTCEVTGIPFDMTVGSGSGNGNPFSPSIDKIDSSKGYTPENTQMVIWLYNTAKHVSTHEHVMRMAKALVLPEEDL